jgi:hypothetical protein
MDREIASSRTKNFIFSPLVLLQTDHHASRHGTAVH